MMMKQSDSFDLEAVFEAARAAPPQMPTALLARIEADTQAQQRPAPIWRRLLDAIGGPAGLGGLVTATVAGFWLGVAPPADTLDLLVLIGATEQATDDDFADLSGFGWYSEEG
ncbi:hypothetical protein [Sulfitobacter sp.]|uniref:hypothetical protein n=1 Tax=Sulfitobacter sp. TaxID=1903071 RepID=UPI0030016639